MSYAAPAAEKPRSNFGRRPSLPRRLTTHAPNPESLPASRLDAAGVNNAGTIVGYYGAAGLRYGFVLSNGTFTSLSAPGAVPGTKPGTRAEGINDAGTVVGYYIDSSGVVHGFVWSNGVYTTLDYPGAKSTEAFGINDSGTIVGEYTDASGVGHGFEATPVPLPGRLVAARSGSRRSCSSVEKVQEADSILTNIVGTVKAGPVFLSPQGLPRNSVLQAKFEMW